MGQRLSSSWVKTGEMKGRGQFHHRGHRPGFLRAPGNLAKVGRPFIDDALQGGMTLRRLSRSTTCCCMRAVHRRVRRASTWPRPPRGERRWGRGTRWSPSSATAAPATRARSSTPSSCASATCPCRPGWGRGRVSEGKAASSDEGGRGAAGSIGPVGSRRAWLRPCCVDRGRRSGWRSSNLPARSAP